MNRPAPAAVPTPSIELARVVCVGSSAGGIEALGTLLAALPAGLPFCFVVAQHVAPSHDALLRGVLARGTTWTVDHARDGALLEPGVVLVAPPGRDVTIDGHAIHVITPQPGPGPSPSIDVLLTSAARSWGDRAVAVILSGTGDDGSAGVVAVRAAGGFTVAQDFAGAGFPAMPESAVATGAVDVMLPAGLIGAALARLARGERAVAVEPVGQPDAPDGAVIRRILEALRASGGVDFSGYKSATLRRQIERRMSALSLQDLRAYLEKLLLHPPEVAVLTSALLVTVTSFFRDPDTWTALEVHLRPLLVRPDLSAPIRLWVPGCATGEEAYTLGMIVAGLLGDPADLSRRLKIFATDLNEDALAVGRTGSYSDDDVEQVPQQYRERWFRRSRDRWSIDQGLRDCVIFARHDVAHDPPFPKVHLISLRNTLIYFDTALQEQALRLLHFGLITGGVLVLGGSERIPHDHDLFESLDGRDRLYRRRTTTPRPLPAHTAGLTDPMPTRVAVAAAHAVDERALLRAALIRRFAPPSLILDENDAVIEVVGDVAPWCWLPEGAHSSHVVALVREELRSTVRSLVLRVRQGGDDGAQRPVRTAAGVVTVGVQHLGEAAVDGRTRLVVSFVAAVQDTPPDATPPADGEQTDDVDPPRSPEVIRMRLELASTETALQATIAQLSTSNEELQALNEELQAAAEELQASNEEVQASNEELEATNEELSLLNTELQQRGNDVAEVNTDLENIQASLTSGLVLVDRDLRVMRYTPLAVRLFALIETDIGRPLTAIPSTMAIPGLQEQLQAARDRQENGFLELHGDRSDMLLHFHPYRGGDGAIRGAIVVSTDISELAGAHRAAQRSLRDLVTVTDALREAVWQRGEDGHLLFVNSQTERLFGVARRRLMTDAGLLLAVVHPEDRERVRLAGVAAPLEPYELEYRIQRPDGEVRWVHEAVTVVAADEDGPGYAVVSALDVTDRRGTERGAQDTIAVLEAVFDNSVFGVLVLDADDRIVRANDRIVRMSGYDRESLVGMPVRLLAPDTEPDHTGASTAASADLGPLTMGIAHRILVAHDGTPFQVTMEIRPLAGDTSARIVIVHDVTRLHEANHDLAARAKFDPQTGLLARTHFRDELGRELARADRTGGGLAVLWIDLDGFKAVNDRYGHQSGDQALREVATRLQQTSRRQDSVGRLGGDEFAMVVTDVDQVDGLESLTERVLAALRSPIQLNDTQIYLSGSIGVALAPEDGTDPDDLLHRADTAMYSAKQAGRDRRVYYRAEMNRIAEARAGIRHDLAVALRARRFELHYQPVVNLATGRVHAVEALIRWRQGDMIVPAAEFMAVAEQTGQLRAIGHVSLDLLDNDLHRLHAALDPTPVSVCLNLSPTQLEERDLLDRFIGWEPAGGFHQLIIEVTEDVALARGGRAVETLRLLRKLGAQLSIDDFGTGYSNFALLDRLRPGIIKMDRSLLVEAADSSRGHAVLSAAIQLAHALEAEVVIEGVEDQKLWDLACALGVEYAQGFHVARPMPLPELLRWLDDRGAGAPASS